MSYRDGSPATGWDRLEKIILTPFLEGDITPFVKEGSTLPAIRGRGDGYRCPADRRAVRGSKRRRRFERGAVGRYTKTP